MTSWKSTFRVVCFANLITAVGMMSFLPFFPSYLAQLGLHDRDEIATWAGLVFGAAPLLAAIMGPIWGSIGDRLGRKLMVVRAMCAIMVFVGGMGFVRSPIELLALRVGQGIFSGFIPPSITLVSIAVPREFQGRITSLLQASLAAGSVLGPVAGAILQSMFGLRSVFFFVAGAAGLSGLLVALFAREDPSLRTTLEHWSPTLLLRGARDDLVALLARPRLRRAIVLLFCVQFGLGASNPLMELYVGDLWRGAPESVAQLTAILFTGLSVAVLVATPLWGRYGDSIGHERALSRATLGSAVLLVLHALVPAYWALFAVRIALGAMTAGPNATAFGLAGVETDAQHRGSAFGAVFSARAFAVSIGAMCGGVVASVVGIPNLLLATGCLVLVFLAVTRRASASPESP